MAACILLRVLPEANRDIERIQNIGRVPKRGHCVSGPMLFYGGARIERLVFGFDGIFVNEYPHIFCKIDRTKELVKHTCTANERRNLPKNNLPLLLVVELNSEGNVGDSLGRVIPLHV